MAKYFVIFVLLFVFSASFAYAGTVVHIECNDSDLANYLYSNLTPGNFFVTRGNNWQYNMIVNVVYTGNNNSSYGGSYYSSSSGYTDVEVEFYAVDSNNIIYHVAGGKRKGVKNSYQSSSSSGIFGSISNSNYKNTLKIPGLLEDINSWIPPQQIDHNSHTGNISAENLVPETSFHLNQDKINQFKPYVGQVWEARNKNNQTIEAIARVAEYHPENAAIAGNLVVRFEYLQIFKTFKLDEVNFQPKEN